MMIRARAASTRMQRKLPLHDPPCGRGEFRSIPAAAATLRWEFVGAGPEHGTIQVAFDATAFEAFTNQMGELGPDEFQVTLDLDATFVRATAPGRLALLAAVIAIAMATAKVVPLHLPAIAVEGGRGS
jgi:hypothetical protein